jgi:hypothetical protein
MNRLVVDVSARFERASATPRGESKPNIPAPREGKAEADLQAADDRSLRGTQVWFSRAVMTSEGPRQGIEARLTAGPKLSADERLDIYRRGYHLRLVECLADDYPAIQHALGEEPFEDLCARYIGAHPSKGPNLNYFGRHMEAFCRGGARSFFDDAQRASFVADLAALEWAIVEVIHAPSADPLTLEGLSHVAPDAWATARLVPNTSVRLLRFDCPVNAYFQAFREGRSPEQPSAAPSMAVVYRSGPTIWRMDLTPPMYEVLSALVAGEKLGDALARAESGLEGVEPAEAMQRVSHWFREWVSSGLFIRVET